LQESHRWTRYVFRSLTFRYRPTCSSTQTGSVAMGVLIDPLAYNDIDGSIVTSWFANVKMLENSCDTAARLPMDMSYTYKGNTLWYVDSPNSNIDSNPGFSGSAAFNAYQRFQQQCMLIGGLDAQFSQATVFGYLDVDYIIDLYGPRPVSYYKYTSPLVERVFSFVEDELLPFLERMDSRDLQNFLKATLGKSKVHPLLDLCHPRNHLCSGVLPKNLRFLWKLQESNVAVDSSSSSSSTSSSGMNGTTSSSSSSSSSNVVGGAFGSFVKL